MNERINELIKQSYVTVRSQNDRDVTYFSQEKFAELIVRECMELGDTALQKGNWPGDAIKKHFEIKD